MEEESLVSIDAVRERYEREMLELSTDVTAKLHLVIPSADTEPGKVIVLFSDYPVEMVLEEEEWTVDELMEALGVTPTTLSSFSCNVSIAVAPTLDHDEKRTHNHLLINLCDDEGDYVAHGYGWRNDDKDWTLDEVSSTFVIPPDAPVWLVVDMVEQQEDVATRLSRIAQGLPPVPAADAE